MQEAEEQDTCRICSAPADIDQPLFHPCKCSGTIRYIHQDCLTTWLAHSKKKNCDVCKHPYSFTKIYAPDMPSTLPPVLLIRRLVQQVLFALLFGLRGIAVAVIWLAFLPWATVWTWRMYFSMGESTAWWISDRPRPTSGGASPFYYTISSDVSVPPPKTFAGRLTAHPLWIALSADIFTGQIIASLIVLTFVAVFLLREWISQNARPGVFEDEEIIAEEQPAAQNPVAVPAPQHGAQLRQEQNLLPHDPLTLRQVEALRDLDILQARQGINGHLVGDERRNHGRSPIERSKKRGKAKQQSAGPANLFDPNMPAHSRKRLFIESPDGVKKGERDFDLERLQRRSFSRRVLAARVQGMRRRAALSGAGTPLTQPTALQVDPLQKKFEFTFRATSQLPDTGRRSISEPRQTVSSSDLIDPEQGVVMTSPSTPIFPPVTLQPPRATIPFSFGRAKSDSSPSSPLVGDEGSPDLGPSSSTSSLSLAKARRPPLPTTTIPALVPTSSLLLSPSKTPLDSPSLATYRAPEELEAEAGPSSLHGYFDPRSEETSEEEDDTDIGPEIIDRKLAMDLQAERDKYFAEPVAAGGDHNGITGLLTLSDSDTDDENGEGLQDDDESGDEDSGYEDDPAGGVGDEEEDRENGDGFVFEEDDEWEAIEAEGDEREGLAAGADPAVGAGRAPGQEPANAAQAPVDGGVPLNVNDEVDGNVEDDMEGAMEAIGMRGPIYGVFQNAALMIFVLDTAIGLGIWIPFTIGKSTALLSLDPQRFLQILHLPIRAMRVVTDPVVDSVAFIIVEFCLPFLFRFALNFGALLSVGGFVFIDKMFGRKAADGLSLFITRTESHIANFSDKPLERLFAWSSTVARTSEAPDSSFVTYTFAGMFPDITSKAEPYFARLGKGVRLGAEHIQATWTRMALGHGPGERAFAVVLGYAVVALLLSLYLNILTVGNAKSAGRAVRSAVRQQLLVFKVAAFIFIELVTFPLACGIVLDFCTVWLFPEANLLSRAAFFLQAPLTAMFYHWVAGTMFMYSFAVLLSGCRSVMRAGAMWFIKDPQDQNSHPIRDILDRPTLTQLRKICVSGAMYSCVVACVVGSVAGLLLLGSKSIMPFRWKNREPLSNVPVDLLFLHLVLPYTMHYFRPKKAIKEFTTAVWKVLAARLRLTSYFFGGRHHSEEHTPRHWRVFSLRSVEELAELDTIQDGSFRRVPATDNLALPRDMRATAAVTEDGEPLDDAARELMASQNVEAEKAKRNFKEDYTVVYIPPHFRYRVICFIALLWVVGAVLLGAIVALPIQLGRSFFEVFTSREVHDGYALIVGFYLLWAGYLVGNAVDRLDKRRQRITGDGPRADLRILVVKRGLLWIAKTTYMVAFLGIVIPTLVSFVVDLYLVLPIRFTLNPDMTPRIRVVDTWALGLLYAKIALHANRIHTPNRITRGIQRIVNNGWTHPDPVLATKEVIGPVTGGLLGMIVFPGAVFRTMQYFLLTVPIDDKFIFMHVYPGIFMFAGLIRSAVVLCRLLSAWSQSIRDKEFLVEMRLRNHEPEKASVTKRGNGSSSAATKVRGTDIDESDNQL